MPMVYFMIAFTILLAGLALGFSLAEASVRAVHQNRHDREMAKAREEAESLRAQLKQAAVANLHQSQGYRASTVIRLVEALGSNLTSDEVIAAMATNPHTYDLRADPMRLGGILFRVGDNRTSYSARPKRTT